MDCQITCVFVWNKEKDRDRVTVVLDHQSILLKPEVHDSRIFLKTLQGNQNISILLV